MKEEEPIGHGPQDELAYRVAYLIAGYIRQKLTHKEHQELDDWVCASMDNQRLFEELTDENNLDAWLKWMEKLPTSVALERVKSRLEFTPVNKKTLFGSLWPYAAAASILLAAFVAYKWINGNTKISPEIGARATAEDIAPGDNRATLTLSDGKVIPLDNSKNGTITAQGNVSITKLDSGELRYQLINPSVQPTKEAYNTLSTPSAGMYKLVLPDGSKVWLNASSSLKYPTLFSGNKRKVELSGEGYFEVTKDQTHPFEVIANGVAVQVLGTHFNVNAYTNEPVLKVTLAEGAVQVNGSVVLKPGEQAHISQDKKITTMFADLETELAWKNGLFIFKQAPLDAVMRQVARWYNCEISFQDPVNEHFNASVPRDVPVSKLLHFLEGTGRVHFRIEDKKIIIMK